MNHQPKIKPELANSDRLIELLSIVVLGMIWGLLIFYYAKMPDLLFTGMTILNRFPHIFNYPVKITPENALRQYSVATRLIRILKLVIMFVFLMIEYFTVRTALHHAAGFGVWFIPVFLMMVNIPVIYYIMLSFRKK